ncbi:hypothetical protein PRZ48_012488 [Zasmidium cellare]|uniref:Uncharacterized protein n=1 Tax=Zasmidium cellare TaxID=395010 RepID=A0ABR0E5G0_ZASCE|nr:hypothetical protein PRZ48_012488 [Zasmidium cellare]
MVQYTWGGRRKETDYWKMYFYRRSPKLLRSQLDKLDFSHHASTGGSRLAYLVTRAERSLMSYEKCSLDELRSFCAARKVQVPESSSRKKTEHIRLLEEADENGMTFSRFLDLPPELRVRIYTYYMDFLGQRTSVFLAPLRDQADLCFTKVLPPPPIAQVSTVMRRESIPMFYDIFRLELRHNAGGEHLAPGTNVEMLRQIPVHLSIHVKKAALTCAMFVDSGSMRQSGTTFSLEVDFATLHKPLSISNLKVSRFFSYQGKDLEVKVLGVIETRFVALLESCKESTMGESTVAEKFKALCDVSTQVGDEVNAVVRKTWTRY